MWILILKFLNLKLEWTSICNSFVNNENDVINDQHKIAIENCNWRCLTLRESKEHQSDVDAVSITLEWIELNEWSKVKVSIIIAVVLRMLCLD